MLPAFLLSLSEFLADNQKLCLRSEQIVRTWRPLIAVYTDSSDMDEYRIHSIIKQPWLETLQWRGERALALAVISEGHS